MAKYAAFNANTKTYIEFANEFAEFLIFLLHKEHLQLTKYY